MNPNEPLSIFFIGGANTRKTFTLIIQVLQNIKSQTKHRFKSIKINSFNNCLHKKNCI
jgi:hypothetical protein